MKNPPKMYAVGTLKKSLKWIMNSQMRSRVNVSA